MLLKAICRLQNHDKNLKTSIQGYEQQISQLRYANRHLTGENTGLKSDVASKSQTIAQQTDSIGRLSTEKASLTSEKENVTRQRDELNTQKEILAKSIALGADTGLWGLRGAAPDLGGDGRGELPGADR